MAVTISGSTGIDIGAGNLTLPDDTTMSSTNGMGATLVRSTAFTVNSAYGYTFSHGQSSTPDLVWGEIKVTSAQHGYSAGDVIKVSSMLELDETDFVMTFWGNASQMGLRANNPDIHRWVAHKTSNTSTDYTFSDGNIEFYLVGVWF